MRKSRFCTDTVRQNLHACSAPIPTAHVRLRTSNRGNLNTNKNEICYVRLILPLYRMDLTIAPQPCRRWSERCARSHRSRNISYLRLFGYRPRQIYLFRYMVTVSLMIRPCPLYVMYTRSKINLTSSRLDFEIIFFATKSENGKCNDCVMRSWSVSCTSCRELRWPCSLHDNYMYPYINGGLGSSLNKFLRQSFHTSVYERRLFNK
jgi:hypothetical protein